MFVLAIVTASIAAFAQSQTPVPLTTATVKKPAVTKPAEQKKVVTTPFINYNPLKPRPQMPSDKIIHVDGESSQPWFRMAGTRPGYSAFPEPGQNNLGFNLFWVGAPPGR